MDCEELMRKMNLRQLTYESRVGIINELVKDIAYRELLCKLLADVEVRPSA